MLGNHDATALADHNLPFTLLRDEIRLVSLRGCEYYLAGLEQTMPDRRPLTESLGELPIDAPLLVLAHYPSTAFELPSGSGILLLAGHTHGGQIRIPRLGCLWTNDRVPRAMGLGLHRVRGNWLHVTAGTGVSGPVPIRMFCPPELCILTLRPCERIRKRRIQVGRGCATAA